ncbi:MULTISPECIES: aldo/keto reductase [unclassified Pseudovibrio]|uniref:aldo/keto reductase n=1 Tax=unclassified Pseudovibrio TaxID=2627060 RepID=UPI0007AE8801|nr:MULTISPECIES: aldo/keto reductase [unclassified Pseudovibrio]KZL03278.1 General stress protein 69 [Pseudovibrio sp. W74]KZL12268.1 General stress protein 69 [Pseudovibrio sp. Ad14]
MTTLTTQSKMELRPMGKSGIDASVIGLGTWAMGGWMWGGGDDKASIDAVRASLDAGVSLIDTAPAYGLGRSEELVGEAIKGRRDEVVLATKCGLVWRTDKGTLFFEEEGKPVYRYLGKDSIIYEAEQSLRRLQTDYIDLFITHWQDSTTPIAETMDALLTLKQQGKIRAIGISNASPEDLQGYVAAGQLDAIQECYSMLDRGIEKTLLPLCKQHDVATLSYSSLALGLLSGKIGPDRVFEGDDQRLKNPRFSVNNRLKIQNFTKDIEPVAKAHDISIAQTVIAWTLTQPGITYALCGARNVKQATENAHAGTLQLADDEVAMISRAIDRHLTGFDDN